MDGERCLQATSTPAIAGSVNVAASSVVQDDGLNVKDEPADTDLDAGPAAPQHGERSKRTVSCVKEERDPLEETSILESEPLLTKEPSGLQVDEYVAADSHQDMEQQRCLQATYNPAMASSMNVAAGSVFQDDGLNIKEEWADTHIDIGPTVLQHMDAPYKPVQLGVSIIKQEIRIIDNHINVKEDIIEDEFRADTDDQLGDKATQSEFVRAQSQLYSCDTCVKSYTSKASLLQHYRNRHSTESHKCTICNKKFPSKGYLYKHISYAHSEHQYECAVCKKICHSKPALRKHFNRVHQSRPADMDGERCLQATSTPAIAGSENVAASSVVQDEGLNVKDEPADTDLTVGGPALPQHVDPHSRRSKLGVSIIKQEIRIIDNNINVIPCCGVKEDIIEDEFRADTDVQLYSCNKCGKTYGSKNALRTHDRNRHSTESHECTKCNKKFPSKHSLYSHTKNVHSEQPYECAICEKIYKSKSALKIHVDNIHQAIPAADTDDQLVNKATQSELVRAQSQLYSCDKCVKSYVSKAYLLKHNRSHHSTEFHECTKCNKKFPWKDYLYKHTRRVHSEQQYECAVCKRICNSKPALYQHVHRVHRSGHADSEPRIYICYYCEKTFTLKDKLATHITCVHGSGSYKCSQCDKCFKCEAYLMGHTRRNHSAESLQLHTCTNCGKNFNTKLSCQRHEKRGKCSRPTASNMSAVASTSLQQHNVVIVKEEPADGELELGPTVFQHMDCNYRPYKLEPQLD